MKLGVANRLLLLGLLPEQGNILTLRVVREARQLLEFKADEVNRFEIVQSGPSFRWNQEKAEEVEIALSDAALGIAREAIKKQDAENKLTVVHIPLWEKLVESMPST